MQYARIEKRQDAALAHFLLEPTSRRGVDANSGAERSRAPVLRRVLVVEDNLDAVHSLVVLLRQDGHQVDFAINGYAALDVARRFLPEVVLLDLGLPGLDGYDVCRRLKQAAPQTRVIAVTAYGSDEQHARARAAGCDLHVVKPYDPQRLLALVRSI